MAVSPLWGLALLAPASHHGRAGPDGLAEKGSIIKRSRQRIGSGLAGLLLLLVLSFGLSNAGAAPSAKDSATASATTTFTFTGGEQIFEVPAGVTSLDVLAVGGKGGSGAGFEEVAGAGGFGAAVTGKLAVTPGQILFIDVAGNGINGGGAAGFNGGGTGGSGSFGGGGGGGASDIRTISRAAGNDTTTLSSRLLIAGGGGGGGGGTTDGAGHAGGNAGQLASGDGSNGEGSAGAGGFGGTQTRGGFSWGTPAGLGQGGGGQGGFSAGGGGGGGLFGGGGGLRAADGFGAGGGGAGSSGFAPTATSTAFSTDTTGVPLVRLTFNPASGKNASGLKYGKVKLNKSKGTALLPVTVPGSGDLSVGGKGVVKKRPAFSGFARLARAITAAGTYNVVVKAKGKKKQKLFSTGKVNVKAVITFKPTSGDAVHDTRGVRLKKN